MSLPKEGRRNNFTESSIFFSSLLYLRNVTLFVLCSQVKQIKFTHIDTGISREPRAIRRDIFDSISVLRWKNVSSKG